LAFGQRVLVKNILLEFPKVICPQKEKADPGTGSALRLKLFSTDH